MTTRAQLYSIGNAMEPLKRMLILPFPQTTLVEEALLLTADSVAATHETLAREAAGGARVYTSPLVVNTPERVPGSILALHT